MYPQFLFSVFAQCFLFPLCLSLMDPLLRPEFLLLLLEQGERSLEDHTRLFLALAHTTSYLDDMLCSFYDASLNTASRALSSEDGPREDFAVLEWTLARHGSPFTLCPEGDLASATPEPAPPERPPVPTPSKLPPEPALPEHNVGSCS